MSIDCTIQSRQEKDSVGVITVFQVPFSVFQKLKCKWPWTSEITMICASFSFLVPVTLCDGINEETELNPESKDTYLSHCRLRKGIFWAMGQWMKMGETYACPSKCSYHPVFEMQWARGQMSRPEHLTSEIRQKPLHLLTILRSYSRRRQWNPTPVLLPRKSHGRRSLGGLQSMGSLESDMTERLHFHFSLSCITEGNGNPLQCSCLENPRDGEA